MVDATFTNNRRAATRTATTCPSVATFGERLQARRKLLGLSIREVSQRCSISFATLGAFERGRQSPMLHQLKDLAKALSCHTAHLVSNELAESEERLAAAMSELASIRTQLEAMSKTATAERETAEVRLQAFETDAAVGAEPF